MSPSPDGLHISGWFLSLSLVMRLLLLPTLLLAACTGGASGGPSADEFVEACLGSVNWERPMCECAEGKASTDLSDVTYAFVIATMREDDAEVERLRGDFSFAEATEAGLFMVNAATTCAATPAP